MQRLIRPVGLVVVAGIVGFALARSAGSGTHKASRALDRNAATTAFAVRYPADWRPTGPASLPGVALSDEVALAPSGSAAPRLTIGAARAATLGSLPAAFLASLPTRPHAQSVVLGAYRFDRYLNLRPRGSAGPVSVYLLAATGSTIVAACGAPSTAGSFAGACEQILATLTLPSGTEPLAAVDAAYALGLNGILATLNRTRVSAGPGLLATDLSERARAADRLAGAESQAARAASRLTPGSGAVANRRLVASLQRAAAGYRALATAARKHDVHGYDAAQKTLSRAQSTLTEAFKALAGLGYRLR